MKVRSVKNEEKVLGANYIIDFYTEVKNLTETYSAYKNIIIEIEGKAQQNQDKGEPSQIDEAEKNAIKVNIQNLRFFAHKAQIHFLTLADIIGVAKDVKNSIEQQYDEINKTFLPDVQTLTKYVISLNKLLVNDIIRNLLETSQSIVNELYGTQ